MPLLLVVVGAVIGGMVGFAIARSARLRRDPVDARPQPERSDGDRSSRLDIDELLATHPTGMVIRDRAGRVEYRNAASRRLVGSHTGTLLDEAVDRHLAAAQDDTLERETVEFYGPPRAVFEVWARPLPDGGSVAFIEDVSERRRLDQVRTDFVANISHELRTPVGALSVLAEAIEEEPDPETVRRVVKRMLAEAERASRTIDDLIELSRIESGGERAKEPVRIGTVVREAVERATELAASRDIAISALDLVGSSGERADGLVVVADRRELVSAVGNLVENAVKYSDAGASVCVRASRVGDWIDISVADQGVGIPRRDLDRIFERFYRVDRARSRVTGGTGLGLSIVRHVATNHGGEVTVSSTEGQGSTFVLRLPAMEVAAANDQPVGPTASEGVA